MMFRRLFRKWFTRVRIHYVDQVVVVNGRRLYGVEATRVGAEIHGFFDRMSKDIDQTMKKIFGGR